MSQWTGNVLEGFEAQRHWGVHSFRNLLNVKGFVAGFFEADRWHGFRGSVLDRAAFVLWLYALASVWKVDRVWFVWAIALGLVPAMSGTFVSYIRYVSVVFPTFVGLALMLQKARKGILLVLVLLGFGIVHGVLVWRFITLRWAG